MLQEESDLQFSAVARGGRSTIFSCRKRRAIYDFGPSLTGEEVDCAMRDWIPEKARQSTQCQWAVSAWCQVRGVKEKVEVVPVKKLRGLLSHTGCFFYLLYL